MWIFHNFLFWREKRSKSAFYFYKWNHFFQNKWNHFGSKLRHKEARLWDGFKLLRVKKQQFQWEEFRAKSSLWTWILRQATRQNFTVTSWPTFFYKWFFQCVLLDFEFGWRGAQVGFSVSDFGAEFGASVDVGRVFSSLQAHGSTNQWCTTLRS